MIKVKCAYCGKEIEIKNYLKKDNNFCCKEHYYLWVKDKTKERHKLICEYCGKEFIYIGGKSHLTRSKHHYCSPECLTNSNRKYNERHNKKNRKYVMWCSAKKRAQKKGLEFDISMEDLPDIPEYCPILGIKLNFNDGVGPTDNSPSLDRIDSTKGYIKGNIEIISNRANRIKADATLEELKLIVDYLTNYFNSND